MYCVLGMNTKHGLENYKNLNANVFTRVGTFKNTTHNLNLSNRAQCMDLYCKLAYPCNIIQNSLLIVNVNYFDMAREVLPIHAKKDRRRSFVLNSGTT